MNDEELIAKYLEGDDEALGILIKNNLQPVLNFLNRLVNDSQIAEDLTQNTFIKVWKKLKRYQRDKKFKPWLFKIARNTALDYLRKKKDLSFSALTVVNENGEKINFDASDGATSPLEQLKKKELADQLDHSLKKLSEVEQSLLFLYYKENMNFREIAVIMDEPIDTIKTRHRRALIKLREIIKF